MGWKQIAPSLAMTAVSNKLLVVGEIQRMRETNPGSPTYGERANMIVVGIATREDYIVEWGESPLLRNPTAQYFYWVVFD